MPPVLLDIPAATVSPRAAVRRGASNRSQSIMAWSTPTLVEICVGLEINGYLPAEF